MSGTVVKSEVIDTSVSDVWLDEEGIMHEVGHEGARVTLTSARREVAAMKRVAGGGRYPILVDIRRCRSVTRDARQYLSGPEAATCVSAVALLTASPLTRIMANFFIGFNRGTFPTRVFTDESAALEWLRGQAPEE